MMHLSLLFSIDIEFIGKVLEKLPFLSFFDFEHLNWVLYRIGILHSKQFTVSLENGEKTIVSGVNAARENAKGLEKEK